MADDDTPAIIPYLNRLSDFLFTSARIAVCTPTTLAMASHSESVNSLSRPTVQETRLFCLERAHLFKLPLHLPFDIFLISPQYA